MFYNKKNPVFMQVLAFRKRLIEIHRIKGDIVSQDSDMNRGIYRAIYEKMKKKLNSKIELKYYDVNYEELPFDQASYSQKYKGKVRHLEFILP